MGIPEKLYHGTCKAFVKHALQNDSRFGPDHDNVSFTPDLEHAKDYAAGWQRPGGLELLAQFFLNVTLDLAEPVILVFDGAALGKLRYRNDCGNDEFYVEKGPVSLKGVREVLV